MSIPLDRLYEFIESVAEKIYNESLVIYRFWPHGSKKLQDLTPAKIYLFEELICQRKLICADQEPLNFDFYQQDWPLLGPLDFDNLLKKHGLTHWLKIKNFKGQFWNSSAPCVILHSEKRSRHVESYKEHDYQMVYYWSHALLALDWYRYAQHSCQQKNVQRTFLIYNRAWSGTREYRLKFTELVIQQKLENSCRMNVNPIEPESGVHYSQHKFIDEKWSPTCVLENYFPSSTSPSWASADFDLQDYESTEIEIVLETLFDDSRLHLTEKSLRPIACGQPFILAGTHGSLEYLRSYGFKTFADIWDESYDTITDADQRLVAVTDLMKQITDWDTETRRKKMEQAKKIVDYNKKHFFSNKFFEDVIEELVENFRATLEYPLDKHKTQIYLEEWKRFITNQDVINFLKSDKKIDKWLFPDFKSATNIINQLEKTINQA